ncbi:DinB family protein [Deinococcus yavapaiensis]|uniref:Putative damage-inducible protein DinB n=1 Tax=Deinococcus yavapaiensis KR-236 TaxID=694435 RepID=A0A318S367_9DEIO|nr:DinB family protein [Deinococcus yavapaiensis]PYE50459.1 putative damage-inducible protein DinB [Deinococcus yavapaiensis KR-236]
MRPTQAPLLTPDTLYQHLRGHRRLTRRTIEAFPDDQLFTFRPAPPMRSFGDLMREVIDMVTPTMRGLTSGEFTWSPPRHGSSKTELLAEWDEADAELDKVWPSLHPEHFTTEASWFGLPPSSGLNKVLYLIDNEVHHRAQGYVYLRLLGIEPPPFYERG